MNNPHFTMPRIRILVANSSRARLFRVDSPTGDLIELSTDVNPEARLHEGDLITDRSGRRADSSKEASGVMEEGTSAKKMEVQRFAKHMAGKLEQERIAGNLEKLYLVATPNFLGEIRKHLKPELKPLIAEEIRKDLTSLDARTLRKHLPERIK